MQRAQLWAYSGGKNWAPENVIQRRKGKGGHCEWDTHVWKRPENVQVVNYLLILQLPG